MGLEPHEELLIVIREGLSSKAADQEAILATVSICIYEQTDERSIPKSVNWLTLAMVELHRVCVLLILSRPM